MLRLIGDLSNASFICLGDRVGTLVTSLFDDEKWALRYFVIHCGPWNDGKKILVSPSAVDRVMWKENWISVDLTLEELREAPEFSSVHLISREQEMVFHNIYRWPPYWAGPGLWGFGTFPRVYANALASSPEEVAKGETPIGKTSSETHLRTVDELVGYRLHAIDGFFGHVRDFVVDDEDWALRYLVVQTEDRWGGRPVLVAPQWCESIDWAEEEMRVNLHRRSIQESPELDLEKLNRNYEQKLYEYYGYAHLVYWSEESQEKPLSTTPQQAGKGL
jgi:hypothetical protein